MLACSPLPGAHPQVLVLVTCKTVKAKRQGEEGGSRLGQQLRAHWPGPLTLYKGSPKLEDPAPRAFPCCDYYNFQLALIPTQPFQTGEPAGVSAGGSNTCIWGMQRWHLAEAPVLAPHCGGLPWHPFFAEEGQHYGPSPTGEGALPPGPFTGHATVKAQYWTKAAILHALGMIFPKWQKMVAHARKILHIGLVGIPVDVVSPEIRPSLPQVWLQQQYQWENLGKQWYYSILSIAYLLPWLLLAIVVDVQWKGYNSFPLSFCRVDILQMPTLTRRRS